MVNKNNTASGLIELIQQTADKIIREKLQDYLQFAIGTIDNIDEIKGRALVKIASADNEMDKYTTVEATIKTDEKIAVGDVVVIIYLRNKTDIFILCKMTSTYESNNISSLGNSKVAGNTIFNSLKAERLSTTSLMINSHYLDLSDLLTGDLNNIVEAGIYSVAASGVSNIPVEHREGALLVFGLSSTVMQVYGITEKSTKEISYVYVRSLISKTEGWTTWKLISFADGENIDAASWKEKLGINILQTSKQPTLVFKTLTALTSGQIFTPSKNGWLLCQSAANKNDAYFKVYYGTSAQAANLIASTFGPEWTSMSYNNAPSMAVPITAGESYYVVFNKYNLKFSEEA